MKCQACDGRGFVTDDVIEHYSIDHDCGFCEGRGTVGLKMWIKIWWWIRTDKMVRG